MTEPVQRPSNQDLAKKRFRTVLAYWIAGGIVVVGIVTSNVLSVVNTFQLTDTADSIDETTTAVRDTQTEGSPLLKEIKRAADAAVGTNDQLLDCLTPGGTCWKESKRRGSDTVASLNEITFFTAACGPRLDGTETPIQAFRIVSACVSELQNRLKEDSP